MLADFQICISVPLRKKWLKQMQNRWSRLKPQSMVDILGIKFEIVEFNEQCF